MAEHRPAPDQELREFREERESLWRITLAPSAWAVHFVVSYGAAAVVCAKLPGAVDGLRLGLGALTLVTLALIGWLGWRSWLQWDLRNTGDRLNREGVSGDRHRFLGQAAVLLSLISAIGVIYVTLPALLLESCR